MAVKKVNTQKQSEDRPDKRSGLKPEIISIIIIGICILVIISVFSGNGKDNSAFSENAIGFLGGIICWTLKGLFGIGAYILPFAVIGYCSCAFFSDTKKIKLSKFIIGVVLFLILISFMHLVGGSRDFSATDCFNLGSESNGGFIGCITGNFLYNILGFGTYILFAVLAIILCVLITGKSFLQTVRNIFFKIKDLFEKDEFLYIKEDNGSDEDISDFEKFNKKEAEDESEKKTLKNDFDEKKNQKTSKNWTNSKKNDNSDSTRTYFGKRVIRRNGKILSINIPKKDNKPQKAQISLFTDFLKKKKKASPMPSFLSRKKAKFNPVSNNKAVIPSVNSSADSMEFSEPIIKGFVYDNQVGSKASFQDNLNNYENQYEDNFNYSDYESNYEINEDNASFYNSPEFEERIIENFKERFKQDMEQKYAEEIHYQFKNNSFDDDEYNEFNDYSEEFENNNNAIDDDTTDDISVLNTEFSQDFSADNFTDENQYQFENDIENSIESSSENDSENDIENSIENSSENNIDTFYPEYAKELSNSIYDEEENDESFVNAVSDYFNGSMGLPYKESSEESPAISAKNDFDSKTSVNIKKEDNKNSSLSKKIDQLAVETLKNLNKQESLNKISPKENINNINSREIKNPNTEFQNQRDMSNISHKKEASVKNEPVPIVNQAKPQKLINENQAQKEVPKKEYIFPPLSLLAKNPISPTQSSREELIENSKILVKTLKSFNVDAQVIEISRGPTVTRYELSIGEGIKVSKILGLADNLAMGLAAKSIRIEAPIPGKAAVGIEIPNKEVSSVYLSEVICDNAFLNFKSKLAFGLGKDITGNVIVADIAKMPHMLIAGRTGSGKSVCINTLITSIIYKSSPEDVKLIMVDPKVVELSVYNGIPHLLIPVVTEPDKASGALNWAVSEMMRRYQLFSETGTRNLKGYNEFMKKNNPEEEYEKVPQIVIIIDELADLMMVASKEVEASICRLAQLARAAGIHLVIATQRPSVDVITGLIKANIPSRIAFAVSSATDSRTILDMGGADKLLGMGDMLFKSVSVDSDKPIRIQGAFVSDKEVEDIVNFLKENNPITYDESLIEKITSTTSQTEKSSSGNNSDSDEEDDLIDEAIAFIVSRGSASGSLLQRKFKIGYNRAARIIETLEERGIVGPATGTSKQRAVLMNRYEYEDYMERRRDYI